MKKNKKILLLSIGILLVISIIISISYAYFYVSVNQDNNNVAQSACFKLTYTDRNDINLQSTIPLSNIEAEKLTPYEFTITNTCNLAATYYVNIETISGSDMSENYLKYKLDNNTPVVLGTIEDNETLINENAVSSRTIDSAILLGGETRTYNLRLWIAEEAPVAAAGKTFESKVVVTASLNKNPYKMIALNFNDGISENTSMQVVDGRLASNLPIPTRDGYVFNGWFDQNDNQITEYTYITEDKTLTASWNKASYELVVDPNGGNWQSFIGQQTYQLEYEEEKNISDPYKTGYTFNNWTIEGNGSTLNNQVFKMGVENAKLTANYSINTYTLTIDPNGGIYNNSSSNTTHNINYNDTLNISVPQREGYEFSGWTLSGENSTLENNTFKMGSENATMKANWTVLSYPWIARHYKQNIGGGDNLDTNYTLVSTDTTEGSANYNTVVTPSVKTYTGFISPSASSITIKTSNNEVNYKYTRFKGNVIINPNTGVYNSQTSNTILNNVYYEETKQISNPTKSCYDFNNWTVSGSGSSIHGTTFTMGYQNTTLTANYTLQRKTITFNANGGSVSTPSATVDCGGKLSSLPTPTREGYIFDGWFDAQTGGNAVTTSTVFTSSMPIYAHWTRITASMITYNNSAYTTCTNVECALNELYTKF